MVIELPSVKYIFITASFPRGIETEDDMGLFTRMVCERVDVDSVFRRVEAMIDRKAVIRKAAGMGSRLVRAACGWSVRG